MHWPAAVSWPSALAGYSGVTTYLQQLHRPGAEAPGPYWMAQRLRGSAVEDDVELHHQITEQLDRLFPTQQTALTFLPNRIG